MNSGIHVSNINSFVFKKGIAGQKVEASSWCVSIWLIRGCYCATGTENNQEELWKWLLRGVGHVASCSFLVERSWHVNACSACCAQESRPEEHAAIDIVYHNITKTWGVCLVLLAGKDGVESRQALNLTVGIRLCWNCILMHLKQRQHWQHGLKIQCDNRNLTAPLGFCWGEKEAERPLGACQRWLLQMS